MGSSGDEGEGKEEFRSFLIRSRCAWGLGGWRLEDRCRRGRQ